MISLKIAKLLASACRERGKTLILVTHDRNLIHPLDRVFDMRAGSLTCIDFMHFWANDDARKLAEGLKAALAQINIVKS